MPVIIEILVSFLSAAGVLISALPIFSHLAAMREISGLIKSAKASKEFIEINKLSNSESKQIVSLTPEELEKLSGEIKKMAMQLEERKRSTIINSLNQQSERGRIEYLNKLLTNSGFNTAVETKI